MTQTAQQLHALISLLEDRDPEVFEHVRGKLASMGAEVIPALENAWQLTHDALFQQRVEQLIRQIQVRHVLSDFEKWLRLPFQDLLDGLIIINRYRLPDLDPALLYRRTEAIKRDIWIELNDSLTQLEAIRIFNLVFYRWHGFKPANSEEQQPNDYFLHHVLESKKGAPMAMALLYLAIAQRLDLAVYGVTLPRYFVLACAQVELDEESPVQPQLVKHVLFYINPVNNGMIFSRAEIDDYIHKLRVEPQPAFYQPVSNTAVIRLYLEMLQEAYVERHQLAESAEISLFIDAMTRLGC